MGLRENTVSKKTVGVRSETPVHSSPASSQNRIPSHYHDANIELDAIERLRSNIMMLDDLQQRLGFINNELESVIGSKKKS